MLSTKKLLYKICTLLDGLNRYQTATPTKVGNVWTSGTIVAYKRGNVGCVKISGATFSEVTQRTTIAQLPVGFRPASEVSGLLDTASAWWFITAGGEIRLDPITARTAWGNITYVVGGVIRKVLSLTCSISERGWAAC